MRIITVYLPVIAIVAFSVFPVAWAFVTSIKPPEEIHTPEVRYWPEQPTWQNYRDLWQKTDFGRQFVNSVIVSGGTTVFCTIVALTASYSFARFRFRGAEGLKRFLLASQMFPKVLLIIPLFSIMQLLGLLNTHHSLIVAYTTFSLPFVVWMLIGFFQSVPRELDEAAMVDGCTRFQALIRVVLPVSSQGIIATALYAFINAWNELLFATMFTSTPEMRTLPVGLSSFIGEYSIAWGQLMAGGIVAALPVIVVFMFLQKYLVQGMTAGAVKG